MSSSREYLAIIGEHASRREEFRAALLRASDVAVAERNDVQSHRDVRPQMIFRNSSAADQCNLRPVTYRARRKVGQHGRREAAARLHGTEAIRASWTLCSCDCGGWKCPVSLTRSRWHGFLQPRTADGAVDDLLADAGNLRRQRALDRQTGVDAVDEILNRILKWRAQRVGGDIFAFEVSCGSAPGSSGRNRRS